MIWNRTTLNIEGNLYFLWYNYYDKTLLIGIDFLNDFDRFRVFSDQFQFRIGEDFRKCSILALVQIKEVGMLNLVKLYYGGMSRFLLLP